MTTDATGTARPIPAFVHERTASWPWVMTAAVVCRRPHRRPDALRDRQRAARVEHRARSAQPDRRGAAAGQSRVAVGTIALLAGIMLSAPGVLVIGLAAPMRSVNHVTAKETPR